MKVLAIGNSFSCDATRYLHQIAKADGCDLTVVNLYIGGCSLYTHYKNMLENSKAYELQFNGYETGFAVSIKEALLAHDWDFITLQQVSGQSINYDTYQPYLEELVKYIHKYCPKAKFAIHQTWAYEQDGVQLKDLGYADQKDMIKDVQSAYEKAAKDSNAVFTIRSGELFQGLLGAGFEKIHRDGFHATFGLGRYALGLLWYQTLTGNEVLQNSFCDFDEPVSEEEMQIVRKCVNDLR